MPLSKRAKNLRLAMQAQNSGHFYNAPSGWPHNHENQLSQQFLTNGRFAEVPPLQVQTPLETPRLRSFSRHPRKGLQQDHLTLLYREPRHAHETIFTATRQLRKFICETTLKSPTRSTRRIAGCSPPPRKKSAHVRPRLGRFDTGQYVCGPLHLTRRRKGAHGPRHRHRYDVVIVGAGPAGLAAAIRLKSLNPDISVVVVEKGSTVGAHIFSGAVIDPIGLDRSRPNGARIRNARSKLRWLSINSTISPRRERRRCPIGRCRN